MGSVVYYTHAESLSNAVGDREAAVDDVLPTINVAVTSRHTHVVEPP